MLAFPGQPRLPKAAAVQAGYELPPGSSREQRDAERVMLDLLGQQLGRDLNPARLAVPSGERVEVDGADADRSDPGRVLGPSGTTMYPRPRLIL